MARHALASARAAVAGQPRKRVTLLGATGSIGRQAAALLMHHAGQFEVVALTAQRQVDELAALARELRPEVAVIGDESRYPALKEALAGSGIRAAAGREAVIAAAAMDAELVLAGIVGLAGLEPVLAAIRRGRAVALANKEPLVAAGMLVTQEAAAYGARLLPVDSEHNAIFQVFDDARPQDITQITLTASGGPFRNLSLAEMRQVTPQQAVRHPNWDMGAKISVDSATLMNKGLECIEAFHLFPVEAEQIRVLIHPESVVHGLVSYIDGTVKAVLSPPDMRTPIASALVWPQRMEVPVPALDLAALGGLHFEEPDGQRFPALDLARRALLTGGAAPVVLNAANEVAVQAFLESRLGFTHIVDVVSSCLDTLSSGHADTLEAILAIDQDARRLAGERISRMRENER